MRKFQTVSDPRLGADWVLRRRRMMLAEMRPVIDNESMGPVPDSPARFDFFCDLRTAAGVHMGPLGSAYGEDDEAPENGEIVKVNGIPVRVLKVTTLMRSDYRLVRYEIEIERATA